MFQCKYWNNPNWTGDSVLVRNEESISHNWGRESPGSGVNQDHFSFHCSGKFEFGEQGTYRFEARTDDGMRVCVEGKCIIVALLPQQVKSYSAEITLDKGIHTVEVRYFELTGDAVAEVQWFLVQTPIPTPTPVATPTPTPMPIQIPTPTPATPAVVQTPAPGPVGRNEMVLFSGEVSKNEKIMPGAAPKQFHLRLGGCGCMRSLTVEVIKLDPSQDQGVLQKEIRLESVRGKAVAEGQEFPVPYNGMSVYIFIWANPGTKLGSFERVTARMKEGGQVVNTLTLAERITIPESLPILSLAYQPLEGSVTGYATIKNAGSRSQTINKLEVNNCSFPTGGSARFYPSGDIVILSGVTLGLRIDITIPTGTQLEGVVFCGLTFERKQEVLTLEQLIN